MSDPAYEGTTFPGSIQNLIKQPTFDSNLRARLREWEKFPSFIGFVKQYESKILKKLKTIGNDEEKRDIGIELYIGFVFSEANCKVEYEPNVPSISRNPDFKISFRSYSFFFEVKRLRRYSPAPEDVCVNGKTGDKTYNIDNERVFKKCGDVICEKIGQVVPGAINLIYIRHNGPDVPNIWDIQKAVSNLMEFKRVNPKRFEKKIKGYKINMIDEFNEYWKQLSAIVISRPKGFISQIWENRDGLSTLNQDIKTKIEEATQLSFRYDFP
jgi:hypothetical protein